MRVDFARCSVCLGAQVTIFARKLFLVLILNRIGAAGAAAISESLKRNTCLQHLDLHDNQMGDAGAAAIAESLRLNTCLQHLNLPGNEIGDAGSAAIAKSLKRNTFLQRLNLENCRIGDAGAAAIAESLMPNSATTGLEMLALLLYGNHSSFRYHSQKSHTHVFFFLSSATMRFRRLGF
jgi:hypothetical protein